MYAGAEVIGIVLDDPDPGAGANATRTATLVIREADGRMSTQRVNPDSTLGRHALTGSCFREGAPIVDPDTHQILGHEMEMIPNPLEQLRR